MDFLQNEYINMDSKILPWRDANLKNREETHVSIMIVTEYLRIVEKALWNHITYIY